MPAPDVECFRSNILIADDEPVIRHLLLRALEQQGYTIGAARDGQQALLLAQERDYDLLITDLEMPAKAGLELIQHFQRHLPRVKIIATSGCSEQLAIAQQLGVDAVFVKPLAISKLIDTVETLLG